MDDVDWGDPDAIAKLRVGDFACGTGALLSAVYEQVASRHERKGGAPADLHRPMMEDVLYGADVLPSAVHITSATLSGVQPDVGFNLSRIYTARLGRQKDGSTRIGSLELLQSSSLLTLINTSDPALRTGSVGEETAAEINAEFRALLDRRVLCDLLGFDDDVYLAVRRLAAKWCAEPSVHGGKPRPLDARFVA